MPVKTRKLTIKLNSKLHITNNNKQRQNKKPNINSRGTNSSDVLNIITYNISWESMSGRKPDWALCSNNTDLKHPRHNSVCVGNVASVLEDNPADFILLQEAENHNHLIQQSSRLTKMEYEMHESSKDKMITFWNKKYKLDKVIRGEFEPGRPWMATLYSNGWCIINVHFGHYRKEQEVHHMNRLFRKIKKAFGDNGIRRIIIGGDFNYDIKKLGQNGILALDNVIFHYHPKNLLTCCINRRVQNDHVIDTQSSLLDIKIPQVSHMASDHKPILATLTN